MLFAVPYFCPWKCQEQINMGAKETAIPAFAARLYERIWMRYSQMSSSVPVSDTFCVTCKSLNSNHLALLRVVYFATLKSVKVLIYSRIRVARPVRDCKRLVSVSQASPRLRIDAFLADPYFCPWKCQEQTDVKFCSSLRYFFA